MTTKVRATSDIQLLCTVPGCGMPQRMSRSGAVCKNGHGGAVGKCPKCNRPGIDTAHCTYCVDNTPAATQNTKAKVRIPVLLLMDGTFAACAIPGFRDEENVNELCDANPGARGHIYIIEAELPEIKPKIVKAKVTKHEKLPGPTEE